MSFPISDSVAPELSGPDLTEETPVQDGPSFGDILSEFEREQTKPVQSAGILEGTVLSVTEDGVFVDIGRKNDGVLDPAPFRDAEGQFTIAPGARVQVSITGTNEQGQFTLSTHQVAVPKDWSGLQAAFDEKKTITGKVVEVIKGGLRVDIGVRAFMPASRSGVPRVEDLGSLVGQEIECRITKLDTDKEDVVVDRRAVVEEAAMAARQKVFDSISEGAVLAGTVRNLTDFGAFVDVGGVDGLLHVADISWTRIAKPADVLKPGDQVQVQVLKINRETRKISLGMKQLQPEPWALAAEQFQPGQRVTGTVARTTDFGAFVELIPGVEGLIHVSEMSWTKKNPRPSDILKPGEAVEVLVLNVNAAEKRIALGLKQALGDPWDEVPVKFPVGTVLEAAPVVSIQKFGAFVQLTEGIEGMIHVGDITHEKRIENPRDVLEMGQTVRCVVTEVDREKKRIRLSMKQLEPTKADLWMAEHTVGDVVTGRVADIRDGRVHVELGEGVTGIYRMESGSKSSAGSSNAQRADITSAAALLAAKFKSGAGAPDSGPRLRIGETRKFQITAIDPQKKRIDLEMESK
jgi:small subunit ribosomal protein S1